MDSMSYDVVIIGGGHAGVEAAAVCSRLKVKTLLVTNNLDRIAYMSCNPSIGGLGKGHIVKEIDCLGGVMGLAADYSTIQFKRLNASKGPAVRGSRAQCDKDVYSKYVKDHLERLPNLDILSGEVCSLVLDGEVCSGVKLIDGCKILAKSVVLCTGTFMRAVMHIGDQRIEGGRVGDKATFGISDQLAESGFKVTRLKTGTPPRLKRSSIDFTSMEEQFGDDKFFPFSFRSTQHSQLPRVSCFLAYTNELTHKIIRENLSSSPMYSGAITGIGPRYCPSIEDKVTRFASKENHQTFLEPEGVDSNSIYLQGISTSLPERIQYDFLRTIKGLENVELIRPGYAVEYDFFEPTQIKSSLETKMLKGLFFAGQINGTSGYEEAACQGLVAGINAVQLVLGESPLILGREESYIGVLIDDLVTKGTKEPYRMMTSRAEHRLHLREDNALERMLPHSLRLGLLSSRDQHKAENIVSQRVELLSFLENNIISPTEVNQEKLRSIGTSVLLKPQSLKEILRRTEVCCSSLSVFGVGIYDASSVCEPVEISVKYEGYITREQILIEQTKRLHASAIPSDIDYTRIKGLSIEEVEKLKLVSPITLGQVTRISGVNPSAVKAILVHLKAKEFISGKKLSVSGARKTESRSPRRET